MRRLNIVFSTTVGRNIGDDFIRFGVRRLIPDWVEYNALYFNRGYQSQQNYNNAWSKHMDAMDLFLLAGTPELVPKNDVFYRWCIAKRVPVMLIGVGTMLRAEQWASSDQVITGVQDTVFDGGGRKLMEQLVPMCVLSIARDQLMQEALVALGYDCKLLPCPSLCSVDELRHGQQKRLGICYRTVAPTDGLPAHYHLGPRDKSALLVEAVYERFSGGGSEWTLFVICHYLGDLLRARQLFPEAKVLYSSEARDYVEFYRQTDFVIGNRLHGALIPAALGIPAIYIGSDSRIDAALQGGQVVLSDKGASSPKELHKQINVALQSDLGAWSERLLAKKSETQQQYQELLETAFQRLEKGEKS